MSEAGPFTRHGIRLPLALSEDPDETDADRDASEPSSPRAALPRRERQ
ncbi:hypothetical protein ABZT49_03720 [Methylobacterium sp. EM32]